MKPEFYRQISETTQISNFTKTRLMTGELFREGGLADGQTGVSFRKFAKAPNNDNTKFIVDVYTELKYEGWNFNFGNTPLDWIQELLEWHANAAGRMGPSPTYLHDGSGLSRNGHTQ